MREIYSFEFRNSRTRFSQFCWKFATAGKLIVFFQPFSTRETTRRRVIIYFDPEIHLFTTVNYRQSCLAFDAANFEFRWFRIVARLQSHCVILLIPTWHVITISAVIIICTSMNSFAEMPHLCLINRLLFIFAVDSREGLNFPELRPVEFFRSQKLHSAIDSRYSIYMQAYLLRSTLRYCCFEKCTRGEWNIHLHVYTDRWKLVFCENIISFHRFVSSLVVSAIIK